MFPVTLLFIDQNEEHLSSFYRAVKDIDRGVHCLLQKRSEDAISLLEEESAPAPDLIFLDQGMPRVSGRECLRYIKQMVRHRHTPVILCTTCQKETDLSSHPGVAGFLTRPFSFIELRNKLSVACACFGLRPSLKQKEADNMNEIPLEL